MWTRFREQKWTHLGERRSPPAFRESAQERGECARSRRGQRTGAALPGTRARSRGASGRPGSGTRSRHPAPGIAGARREASGAERRRSERGGATRVSASIQRIRHLSRNATGLAAFAIADSLRRARSRQPPQPRPRSPRRRDERASEAMDTSVATTADGPSPGPLDLHVGSATILAWSAAQAWRRTRHQACAVLHMAERRPTDMATHWSDTAILPRPSTCREWLASLPLDGEREAVQPTPPSARLKMVPRC